MFPLTHPLSAPVHDDTFGLNTNVLLPARSASVDQAFLNTSTHYAPPSQLPGRLSVPSWAPSMTDHLSNETYGGSGSGGGGGVDSTSTGSMTSMIPTPIPTPLTDPALDYFGHGTMTNPNPNRSLPLFPPIGAQELFATRQQSTQDPAVPLPQSDTARE